MISIILVGLILATAFPIGFLLAWLCRDELKQGRKYFKLIAGVCVVGIAGLLILYRNFSAILTLAYICIVSLISVHMGYDRNLRTL